MGFFALARVNPKVSLQYLLHHEWNGTKLDSHGKYFFEVISVLHVCFADILVAKCVYFRSRW